jgi:hypothetical protein
VNTARDHEVRRVLAPLASMAAEEGCLVLGVRHLNKSEGGNPLYRGGGSIGIIGAARAALLVAPDPDDPSGERVVLAMNKCNLAKLPPSWSYTRVTSDVSGVLVIRWERVSRHTAKSLLAVSRREGKTGSTRDIDAWLKEMLKDGPRLVEQIEALGEAEGYRRDPLRRARERIGAVAEKTGPPPAPWRWRLPGVLRPGPPKGGKDGKDGSPGRDAALVPPLPEGPVDGPLPGVDGPGADERDGWKAVPPSLSCPTCGTCVWKPIGAGQFVCENGCTPKKAPPWRCPVPTCGALEREEYPELGEYACLGCGAGGRL